MEETRGVTAWGRWVAAMLAVAGFAAAATAQSSSEDVRVSDVKVGFNGVGRAGRWIPVFVRASSAKPRNVRFELLTPATSTVSIRVHESVTLAPVEQTYALLAPLPPTLTDVSLAVRDAETERLLLDMPLETVPRSGNPYPGNQSLTIGVSGRVSLDAKRGSQDTVGYLAPMYLPDVPQGYESLDVLILNQLDASQLSTEQQTAIADWVSAGGWLVVFPHVNPAALAGPMGDLLPCTVGPAQTADFDAATLDKAGLPRRLARIPSHALTPLPGAHSKPLFPGHANDGTRVVWDHHGFGRVAVAPTDPTGLQFNSDDAGNRFWTAILGEAPTREGGGQSAFANYQRKQAAVSQILDLLGDVPGVGSFGFGYVAFVLGAMALLVGPVDWLVLRWTGRQPWTWVTVSGWIALITTGAVFIGHLVRSGDLHLRTLRVVEQADDAVVARTDFVGVYSPRTAEYRLATPERSWWQPTNADQYFVYRTSGSLNVLPTRQDAGGNRPMDMTINVWNLQFLTGEVIGKDKPMLAAKLTCPDPRATGARVAGSITNVSGLPLRLTAIRIGRQAAVLHNIPRSPEVRFPPESLPPGATATIDLPLTPAPQRPPERVPLAGNPTAHPSLSEATDLVGTALEAAGDALQADAVFREERSNVASVEAIAVDVPPLETLPGDKPIEKHWLVLRALVRVTK